LYYYGKEKNIQFKNIEHYPLDIMSPNEISILITDFNGYKVPFETLAVPKSKVRAINNAYPNIIYLELK